MSMLARTRLKTKERKKEDMIHLNTLKAFRGVCELVRARRRRLQYILMRRHTDSALKGFVNNFGQGGMGMDHHT
jgi:hypothetical protein